MLYFFLKLTKNSHSLNPNPVWEMKHLNIKTHPSHYSTMKQSKRCIIGLLSGLQFRTTGRLYKILMCIFFRCLLQLFAFGKDEVPSSNLGSSSRKASPSGLAFFAHRPWRGSETKPLITCRNLALSIRFSTSRLHLSNTFYIIQA